MFLKTLRDIARPQVVAIFDIIKRSGGLSVAEIAREMGMSYMGVKQHCLELEKKGYLDTWRRAKEVGRPELAYRLTEKAQALYPRLSNELSLGLLDAVSQLYGANAAEKLLFTYLTKKGEAYAKRLKGRSVAEKATALARIRDGEGHCAQIEFDARQGFRLVEFHSPLREVMVKYPSVGRMEEAMMARLLQTKVTRSEEVVSGLTRYTFSIATMAAMSQTPVPPADEAEAGAPAGRRGEPRFGRGGAGESAGGSAVRPGRATQPGRQSVPATEPPAEEDLLLAMP